jgi:predicted RNA-binding protein with RPS1 domain
MITPKIEKIAVIVKLSDGKIGQVLLSKSLDSYVIDLIEQLHSGKTIKVLEMKGIDL